MISQTVSSHPEFSSELSSKSYSGPILFKFSVQRGGVVSNMAWSADESTIFLDKRRNEGFIPGTNQLCKNANISQKKLYFSAKKAESFFLRLSFFVA